MRFYPEVELFDVRKNQELSRRSGRSLRFSQRPVLRGS